MGVGLWDGGGPVQERSEDGDDDGRDERAPEQAAGGPPARQPPAAGQQQPRQRAEQHQIVVGPAEAVFGAQPYQSHHGAQQRGDGPEHQRDGGGGLGAARLQPCPRGGDGEAGDQPAPPCALEFRRFGGNAMRRDLFLAGDQRAAVGELCGAQAGGEAHRYVGLFPARHRLVGRWAQADVEAQPHPRRGRGQAHGFAAEGVALRTCGELGFERAAEGAVDGVADAGGAVVDEVVVAIARVLGLRVLGQRGGHGVGLHGSEIEPLDAHAAAAVEVVLQVLPPCQAREVVAHVALDEPAHEVGLGHVEEAEVVRQRFAQCGIVHDDGVVAEALEENLARLHRRNADARYGRLHGPRHVLRGAGDAEDQCEQRCQQRRDNRAAAALAMIRRHARSRAACADGGHRRVPPGSRNGRGSALRRLPAGGRWRR